MAELVFEVVQEADGGYCAECLTESIFTQANSWDDLRRNVIEAVNALYFDTSAPAIFVFTLSAMRFCTSRETSSRRFTSASRRRALQTLAICPSASQHRIAIPAYQTIRGGTLNPILHSVAQHKGVSRDAVIDRI